MEPIIINIHPREYKNYDATESLIRYITRTRHDETIEKRKELLLWGHNAGYIYPKSIETLICEFEFVQRIYKAKGTKMCHYTIRLRQEHFQKLDCNMQRVADYGVACCNYIFFMGHQSCFAIHTSKEEGLHIHLAINNINYINGKPLCQYPKEIYKTIERPLIEIFNKHAYIHTNFNQYGVN